jgi:hypothetical protein
LADHAAGRGVASPSVGVSVEPEQDPDVEPTLVDEVRSYFRAHPHAADSLEGIARWRLLEERALRQVEATQRALRHLVARGELVEETQSGMAPLYRLPPDAQGAEGDE